MPPADPTPTTPALPPDAPAELTALDAAPWLPLELIAAELDAWEAGTLGAYAATTAAAPLPTDYAVQGAPRISPELFQEVLTLAQSPAAAENAGDALYAIPVAYGLDPGVALAFFFHESKYGTMGIARTTNGWGNQRRSPTGRGEVRVIPGRGPFAHYTSWADSLHDWCALILGAVYVGAGRDLVSEIIPVYAPSSDNNKPAAYIASVVRAVTAWHRLSGPGPYQRDPWAAWGTLYPLDAQQRSYAIPRRWLAEGDLGAALGPELYDYHGQRSMQWFERGLIVWLGGDRTEVVR